MQPDDIIQDWIMATLKVSLNGKKICVDTLTGKWKSSYSLLICNNWILNYKHKNESNTVRSSSGCSK